MKRRDDILGDGEWVTWPEAAAIARADYLRTPTGSAEVLRSTSGTQKASDLWCCVVGRVGLEPTTQGL